MASDPSQRGWRVHRTGLIQALYESRLAPLHTAATAGPPPLGPELSAVRADLVDHLVTREHLTRERPRSEPAVFTARILSTPQTSRTART
ncbi:hypothetical protein ACIQAC_18160 [Streptomyces sp. NPDC088387]|uniref:hypothetical protein n=1 Tax=Streptomyces sp. NPDC088387 TaxID=3365859 RepID=UPI0037FB2B7E